MKKLFCCTLMLFVGVTTASSRITKDSSWSKIKNDYTYSAEFPQVFVGGVFISYDEFCHTDDMLIASDREICIKRDEQSECIDWEVREMKTPIIYNASECIEWENKSGDCVRREMVKITRPLTISVEVCRENMKVGCVKEFEKSYTIPLCD